MDIPKDAPLFRFSQFILRAMALPLYAGCDAAITVNADQPEKLRHYSHRKFPDALPPTGAGR
jgi:hypothetical protein